MILKNSIKSPCIRIHFYLYYISLFIFFVTLFSCSLSNQIRTAENSSRNKHFEEALEIFMKLLKSNPDCIDLKIEIDRLLKNASNYYYSLAMENEKMKMKEMAIFLYKKSLDFDPGNNLSRKALSILIDLEDKKKNIGIIKNEIEISHDYPKIFFRTEPIELVFENKINLMRIFDILAKVSDINFVFDTDFRDRNVTFSLIQNAFKEALELLCIMFQINYYILDDKNILITSDTINSKKRYKKLVMRNLYYFNIEAHIAKQVIESFIKPEKLVVNNNTNSLIVTDSLNNITLIEKISYLIDKREGEVEIEVEIMEVDKKKLKEYGSELSSYQIGGEIDGFTQGKRLNNFFYLSLDDFILSIPRVIWKLFSSVTKTKILARPRIRDLNKEKIEIMLEEKLPILRTTFVPISTGGQDQQPITAFDMKDVGISITIIPIIHHNLEITLSLFFELTYVTDRGRTFLPPTLGSRKVVTKLRLNDGETGIIAGLTKGTSTEGTVGIPVLDSLPFLKEIFSSRNRTKESTDILFSITPHILRLPDINQNDLDLIFIETGNEVYLKKRKKK